MWCENDDGPGSDLLITAWNVAGMLAPVAPEGVNEMKSPSFTAALPPALLQRVAGAGAGATGCDRKRAGADVGAAVDGDGDQPR